MSMTIPQAHSVPLPAEIEPAILPQAAHSTAASAKEETAPGAGAKRYPIGQDPRLRYHEPYWFPYRTFAKQRWVSRCTSCLYRRT